MVGAMCVSKFYVTVEALKTFGLKMKSGDMTEILGHNGARSLYTCFIFD